MEKTEQMKYQKHIFNNLTDVSNDLIKSPTIEGKKMNRVLRPFIIKLQNIGIEKLQNITKIFRDCGLNNKSTNEIILYLLIHLNKKTLINSRVVKKMNDSYRNIIFASLFNDIPDKIISLIDVFITNHCPDIHNHDFLIHQLKQIDFSKTDQEVNEIIENNDNQLSHLLSLLNAKFDDNYFNDCSIDLDRLFDK